ncbi:hypothetical protein MLD38_022697 [Melastoma candidum]|uniref:Uncharacterized protein n=1 Tax=Melastoma candidum TaxID=119954 RepID=A0ACB9QKP6_9MYRT|nr:hypothetical protein MLD38_022697 [Melastoma candidum]
MATKPEKDRPNKEGTYLLGLPTFVDLPNGRLMCVETGHELLPKDKDSYSRSKRCRVALIDLTVSRRSPPLNFFTQDPLNRDKLICSMTKDTVNKSEEHIWKHINGRRFLNRLEQKVSEKLKPKEPVHENGKGNPRKVKNGKVVDGGKKKKSIEEVRHEMREPSEKDSDLDDAEFWMPPAGHRNDHEDELFEGTGSDSGSDGQDNQMESEELSKQTKRLSIEVGPSSFASRKKKQKKLHKC